MRSKLVLAAALIMGLITTVLFFNYMKSFNEAAKSSEQQVEVLAAKQDIPENTRLSAAMLQVIRVPALGVEATALTGLKQAEGKIAAVKLVPGEVLLAHHVTDQKEETLFVSRKVREGYRAMSVGVNLVQSVSNLIEPGDYVDVVSTIKDPATDKLQSTLVQGQVRVLAIGRRMLEARTDTPYVEYASVTLEVKPEDGIRVIQAGEEGVLSLMLHSRVIEQAAAAPEKKP
ncbi:Flp pilus assembly protein CpaB [Paenibacillus sp. YYML68]|uniref:Flp pilus assembly protein CpaB n=1 Tax=Paenibacillus sp. YYML68 TaxID=2909250 RepID=UPI0024927A54|nr:Flp pilus assembly protein CpaB [Paenibacillus sp. YYML68]